MASLHLKLLGGFAARLGSGQPIDVAGKKNQALLAYLALNAGKKISREKLIALLWSDRGEEQGRNSLRQALAALKQALSGIDPSPLLLNGDQVALDLAGTSCDAVQFLTLAKHDSADELRHAAALYESQLLDGISVRDPAFEEWLSTERAHFQEAAAIALGKAADQCEGSEAIMLAQRALSLDPLREASHRALMKAHAAGGEKTLALQAYTACRDTLKAELGVAPSPATEELRRRILEDELRASAPKEQALRTSVRQKAASIAVLPFTNMSADPDQEYFSDGITDDIITDLSQVSALYVAARNSTFTFKGRAVDIAEAAHKLKVGHILEGSVRRAGNRVRITAQLIDAETGDHVWAERYDREIGDIFALQDDISKNVVAALRVKLLPEEADAMRSRSTRNAEAYECYLLGRSTLYGNWGHKESLKAARELFAKATEIDPGYARAYAGLADCDTYLWSAGDIDIPPADILANSTRALGLAPNLAEAHASKGLALYRAGYPDEATFAFERAIQLDPELFEAHFFYGVTCKFTGQNERAVGHFQRAAKLRSTDYIGLNLLADVYATLGLREQCVSTASEAIARIEAVLARDPENPVVLAWGASTLAYMSEIKKAEEWANRAVSSGASDYFVRHVAASAYAAIGRPEAALECLEFVYSRAPRARPVLLRWVSYDTQLAALRDRPDYRAFLKRLESDVSARLMPGGAERPDGGNMSAPVPLR